MDDHTVTGRVAAILDAVAAGLGPATLARLAGDTGIPKPTVRRIANQLVEWRILAKNPDGYRLGLRLIELGRTAVAQLGVSELVAPFVHQLHQQTGQIAWACAVSEDSLIFLDTAFGREHASDMAGWPWRIPLATIATTAAGQLMLAAQPERVEQLLRAGGPTRLTPYTVTSPRLVLGRVQRAADTHTAHEWEESRLGWWCCSTLVSAPSADYIVGLTAQTSRSQLRPATTQLRRVAEDFERQVTLAAG